MQASHPAVERPRPGRGLVGFAVLLSLPLGAAHGLALLSQLDARAAAPALLAGVLGALAADGVTGFVHWACDTWGDEATPWLGPGLIRAFREHHRDPRAMLGHDWIDVNREPAAAASLVLLLLALPPVQRALGTHTLVYGFVWSSIVYGAAANQLHQWAHRERPPRLVRLAQRCGLILSRERHARHHRAPSASAYCISTGWLNPVLDGVGFWRTLERGVTRVTGAEPRRRAGAGRAGRMSPREHGERERERT